MSVLTKDARIRFIDFLIEDPKIGAGTAKSYSKSYIDGIDRVLRDTCDLGLIETLAALVIKHNPKVNTVTVLEQDHGEGVKFILRDFLFNYCRVNDQGNLSQKTWQNYLSGSMRLIDFLYYDEYKINFTKASIPKFIENYNPSVLEYTNADLKKIFESRLNTQDRINKTIPLIFSSRVLSVQKYYPNKADYYFKDWKSNQIEQLDFIINSSGNIIKFPKVKKLKLIKDPSKTNEWSVKIYDKKVKEYQLYSRTKDGFKVLKTNQISKITLEHTIPISNILEYLVKSGKVTALKKISDIIHENDCYNQKKNGVKMNEEGIGMMRERVFNNQTMVLQLNGELKLLEEQLQLEMMCGSENSSRGNKN